MTSAVREQTMGKSVTEGEMVVRGWVVFIAVWVVVVAVVLGGLTLLTLWLATSAMHR